MRDTDRDLTSHHPGPRRQRHRRRSRDLRGRIVAVGAQRLAAGDADSVELPGGSRARRRDRTSRSSCSTCWSASTAITSAASATPSARSLRGEARRGVHHRRESPGVHPRRHAFRPASTRSARPDAALRSLQLHGARRRSARAGRAVSASCCCAMSYADAEVRPLLDLEGLKQWVPGRVERLCAARRRPSIASARSTRSSSDFVARCR